MLAGRLASVCENAHLLRPIEIAGGFEVPFGAVSPELIRAAFEGISCDL